MNKLFGISQIHGILFLKMDTWYLYIAFSSWPALPIISFMARLVFTLSSISKAQILEHLRIFHHWWRIYQFRSTWKYTRSNFEFGSTSPASSIMAVLQNIYMELSNDDWWWPESKTIIVVVLVIIQKKIFLLEFGDFCFDDYTKNFNPKKS